MNPTLIATLVSVLALILAGYAIVQARAAGEPLTPALFTSTLEAATPKAADVTEAALTGVQAAEQLWRTGKITRDARLTHALDYVRKWFPDLDDDTLVTAIESAVLVVNTVVDQLPAKADH